MQAWKDDSIEANQPEPGPFRATPGFIAFVGLLLAPAIVALSVYAGAALVADEVRAAEAKDFSVASGESDVAGWKRALVGVCPAH